MCFCSRLLVKSHRHFTLAAKHHAANESKINCCWYKFVLLIDFREKPVGTLPLDEGFPLTVPYG